MKKIISLIIAIATLFTVCLNLVGCGGKKASRTFDLNGNTITMAEFTDYDGEETIIYDYDDIEDFRQINAEPGFGLTKLNTDQQYIKNGTGSMHVRVDGYGEMYHFPETIMDQKQVIVMYPKWFMKSNNFSDALCFRVSVYNVGDRDVTIGLRIDTGISHVVYEPQIAVKGVWTEIEFVVDRNRALYQGLDAVNEMFFVFENREQGQTPAELYLDDFRYVKSNTPAKKLDYIPTPKANELCDFEDRYFDITSTVKFISYPNIGFYDTAKLTWNSDKKYVSSGNYSMKITRFPNVYNNSIFPKWQDVYLLSDEYIASIDWEQYDRETTSIAVDVYNDYQEPVMIRFSILDSASQGLTKDTTLMPNTWTTIKMPLNTNPIMELVNLSYINIMFREFYGTENMNIYVDNMRFVQG